MDILTWCEATGATIAITGSIDPRQESRRFQAALVWGVDATLTAAGGPVTGEGCDVDAAITDLAAKVSEKSLALSAGEHSAMLQCPSLSYSPPRRTVTRTASRSSTDKDKKEE